eukprot:scaffold2349_cov407-Prasinococcus_capsulatus_cf.AAC.17
MQMVMPCHTSPTLVMHIYKNGPIFSVHILPSSPLLAAPGLTSAGDGARTVASHWVARRGPVAENPH